MLDASAPRRDDVPDSPVIAFFDLDNTLLRGASIYHLGRGARHLGVMRLRDVIMFAWHQAWFIAVGENRNHMHDVRERALQLIRGHTEQELLDLTAEVYDRFIAPRLWPETVALAHDHLRRGHEVWLITATPVTVAKVIAERLGVTGALGTLIEVEDGVFTGRVAGQLMHGDYKVIAATALTTRLGADVECCWAYSDSGNDIPLLQLVGHRVAVNPDAALRRHAHDNGWSTLKLGAASIREARRRERAGTARYRRSPESRNDPAA